jgi:aldose 1-epimerase
MDGSDQRQGRGAYLKRGAFCVETQHYPDSPKPSEVPEHGPPPGPTYHEVTVYRFTTAK